MYAIRSYYVISVEDSQLKEVIIGSPEIMEIVVGRVFEDHVENFGTDNCAYGLQVTVEERSYNFV